MGFKGILIWLKNSIIMYELLMCSRQGDVVWVNVFVN